MIKQIIAKMSAKYTLDVGVGVPLDKELDDDTFELVSPFRTMVPKHRDTQRHKRGKKSSKRKSRKKSHKRSLRKSLSKKARRNFA